MDKRILASMAFMLIGSASIAAYHKLFNKHEGIVFTITPPEGKIQVNDSITYKDQTPGATRCRWDFGDGEVSDKESGVHTYMLPGRYQVSLTTYGSFGTLKKSWGEIEVGGATDVQQGATEIEGPESTIAGQPITYTVNTAAAAYDWTVEGDDALSTKHQKSKTATYRFASPGIRMIVLTTHSPEQTLRKQIQVQGVVNAPVARNVLTSPPVSPKVGTKPPKANRHNTDKEEPAPLPDIGDGILINSGKKK